MANIKSIGGNPIVLGMDGLSEDIRGTLLGDVIAGAITAGAAEGITGGGPTNTAAWMERACPGTDGPATIGSIHGNTVVWNQLNNGYATGSFVEVAGLTRSEGATGGLTITGTATESPTNNTLYLSKQVSLKRDGRKYLFMSSKPIGYPICVNGYTGSTVNAQAFIWSKTDGTNWHGALCANVENGSAVDISDVHFSIFDLTLMFGAGNEPSTVAEFERMFPESYYPYDAGSLLSVNLTGIESADANGNVLQQRTIPATTYFPNGLCSVGTIRDELTADAAIARVGAVDLGTLSWSRHGNGYFYTYLTPKAPGNFNLVCDRYPTTDSTSVGGMADKSIKGNASSDAVYVVDSSYTDAASFKAAMDGVMLHYALATPTTTPIDPALNLTYKAAQGGTERVMYDEPSAPPTMVVQYGSTADGIRDRALACIAPVENGLASANYAIGSYLIHGGQLCKVTTAIASGESITPGTNVTATTVMAEVIALTS